MHKAYISCHALVNVIWGLGRQWLSRTYWWYWLEYPPSCDPEPWAQKWPTFRRWNAAPSRPRICTCRPCRGTREASDSSNLSEERIFRTPPRPRSFAWPARSPVRNFPSSLTTTTTLSRFSFPKILFPSSTPKTSLRRRSWSTLTPTTSMTSLRHHSSKRLLTSSTSTLPSKHFCLKTKWIISKYRPNPVSLG